MVTSRLQLTLGATYSNWQTPVASGVYDTMNIYGATTQLRFLLSDNVAATAGYYTTTTATRPGALPRLPGRVRPQRRAVRLHGVGAARGSVHFSALMQR